MATFLQTAHASYLALAAHPELKVSKSALWYAVAGEDNVRLLGDAGGCLGVSHHKRLVHVADPATRTALAGQAIDGARPRCVSREDEHAWIRNHGGAFKTKRAPPAAEGFAGPGRPG